MVLPLENVSLSSHTTMRIGGSARYFISVHTEDEMCEAVRFAHKNKLPFFVLGGGSNIIFPDSGFLGVVIKIEIPGIVFEEHGRKIFAHGGGGVSWDALVAESVKHNLWGIENLSAIPGTVGASAVQNIGAYGVEVKDTIEWVRAYDIQRDIFVTLSRDECAFAYRTSIFKKSAGKKLVVMKVVFCLSKNGIPNLRYGDIAKYFLDQSPETISVLEMRGAIIKIRGQKLPNPQTLPNAGSFFKNPVISKDQYLKVQNAFPGIKGHEYLGKVKISAAWLIEMCGWKGVRYKDAGITQKHALVIANYGNASAHDIVHLSECITRDVFERTGIVLEREVIII